MSAQSFIFTLEEFAKELISLVDAVERIYCYHQHLLHRTLWPIRLMSWAGGIIKSLFRHKPPGIRRKTLNIRKSLGAYNLIIRHDRQLIIPSPAYMIPQHRLAHPSFPKIRPHAPDTLQTPSRDKLSFWGKVNQTLWTIGKRLKERDTKYAIKAGMATALLASPAFIDATRHTFVAYWGDWALISVRPRYYIFC